MRTINENDTKYNIGENAIDNTTMVSQLKKININYWWFHLADFPSAHIIVEKTKLLELDILYTCMLLKMNSKYKDYKKIKINYTQLKNVKITDIPGLVEIKRFKTIQF